MMKNTKILFMLLVVILAFSLLACNELIDNGGNTPGGSTPGADTPAVTEPVDPPLNGYVVDELTIGGIDITKYVIVQGDGLSAVEKLLVPKLQAQIKRLCGAELPIVLKDSAPAEYEILIGNTGREETSVALEAGYATVKQAGNKIVLYGNGEYSLTYVLKTFISYILGAVPTTRVYNIEMPVIDNQPYENPNLAGTNMPLILTDYKAEGTYDPDFTNTANVVNRFYAALNEFPEEVSIIPRYSAEDFPLSMQTQLYVAPDGNDANEGTIDSPLATIEAAVKKVSSAYGAVIWVRGGVYSTKVNLRSVNGSTVSPVIISAYGDETPIFTTGKSLNPADFAPVDYTNDKVAQRIPAAAQSSIVVANLKALGWTDKEIGAITQDGHPQIYFNGVVGNLARYPNAGEPNLYFDYVFDTGSVTAGTSNSNLYAGWIKRVQSGEFDKPGVVYYTDKWGNRNLDWGWVIRMKDFTPCEWVNTGNIWYFGNVFSGWETGYYNIESFDLTSKKMTSKTGSAYGAMHSTNSPTGYNTYYLFNAIECLDTAGEWFYDVDTGNLYIYKTEGFESASILYAAPSTDNTIQITSSKNVIINGLTVNVSGNYGIYATVCDNLIVQGCTVMNTGSYGIYFHTDTRNSAITYNDVSQTGEAMIYAHVGNVPQGTLVPTRYIIQNNFCHNSFEDVNNGINTGGYLSVVSHNVLEDCNINLSSAAECIVEYNDVRGGSKTISDAGLIYLFALFNHGNHIRYNYLHDWNAPGTGIYFDDMSMNQYAYYNIIDSTEATRSKAINLLYTSTGHYNVFFGNILVGRSIDYVHESCIFFWGNSLAYRFPERMKEYNSTLPSRYNLGKFYTRFPELELHYDLVAQYMKDSAKAGYSSNANEVYLRSPQNNVIMNNVILGCKTPIYQPILEKNDPTTGAAMTSLDHIANNYSSVDVNSIVADYKNGDFTILPEALSEIKSEIPEFWQVTTEYVGFTYDK